MGDKNSITHDINYLRQWISKQPHLPQDHDDAWLEKFLRGCKYRTEKCKDAIDKYYTARSTFPEIFSNRDPTSDELRKVADSTLQICLPKTTPEGYAVFITILDDFYTHFEDPTLLLKRLTMMFDAHIVLESSVEFVYIHDAKCETISSSPKLTPAFVKAFLYTWKSKPIRLKSLHVINTPGWFSKVVNMGKQLLTEKMRNRVFVYAEGIEELYKYVPREILPLEYGGDAGSIKDINEEWQRKLESLKEWFLSEESKKTNESLRVEKNSAFDDMYGIDGTFKQLNVN